MFQVLPYFEFSSTELWMNARKGLETENIFFALAFAFLSFLCVKEAFKLSGLCCGKIDDSRRMLCHLHIENFHEYIFLGKLKLNKPNLVESYNFILNIKLMINAPNKKLLPTQSVSTVMTCLRERLNSDSEWAS